MDQEKQPENTLVERKYMIVDNKQVQVHRKTPVHRMGGQKDEKIKKDNLTNQKKEADRKKLLVHIRKVVLMLNYQEEDLKEYLKNVGGGGSIQSDSTLQTDDLSTAMEALTKAQRST